MNWIKILALIRLKFKQDIETGEIEMIYRGTYDIRELMQDYYLVIKIIDIMKGVIFLIKLNQNIQINQSMLLGFH